jgi:hypothetical protein
VREQPAQELAVLRQRELIQLVLVQLVLAQLVLAQLVQPQRELVVLAQVVQLVQPKLVSLQPVPTSELVEFQP